MKTKVPDREVACTNRYKAKKKEKKREKQQQQQQQQQTVPSSQETFERSTCEAIKRDRR
jgi:hypothetical protein